MARRRYISTKMGQDSKIVKLATQSEFAALFYTWAIPHAEDDAILYGDPEEIRCAVIPGLRHKTSDDVAEAITLIEQFGLWEWDRDNDRVLFPISSFYTYQSKIPVDKRRKSHQGSLSLDGALLRSNERETPQKGASPSLSPSPSTYHSSLSPSPSLSSGAAKPGASTGQGFASRSGGDAGNGAWRSPNQEGGTPIAGIMRGLKEQLLGAQQAAATSDTEGEVKPE